MCNGSGKFVRRTVCAITTVTEELRTDMKATSLITAGVLAAAVCTVNAITIIYTQGFNSATLPVDWATEIVTNGSPAPAIIFTNASAHPSGFAPYEGTHFVRFNSFDCSAGTSIRLKRTRVSRRSGFRMSEWRSPGRAIQNMWAQPTASWCSAPPTASLGRMPAPIRAMAVSAITGRKISRCCRRRNQSAGSLHRFSVCVRLWE